MELPKDDFKWFGKGFDGFPKRLPDNNIEYDIYILDRNLKDIEVREKLRGVHTGAHALTRRLLKGFIWQHESFELELVRSDNKGSFLRGRTNYGDSVEDEWLIVYLLRELSKQFPEIWIKVFDTDGEFLLIEAANALPRWLNPEIADNRVWLNGGQLLLIPISSDPRVVRKPITNPRTLTLQDACNCIREDRSKLLHSPMIEREAFYRLRNYPKQIADGLHHALISIPRKLAYVLRQDASYISPAVDAFYLRDSIALRPLRHQGKMGLTFFPDDLIIMCVKFTKVGYAQLKGQRFPPPPCWAKFMSMATSDQSRAQAEIGMKVTCGFEMLLSDPQNQDKRCVQEIRLLLNDINSREDILPSDSDILSWGGREDSETWLDIDFDDFENELSGKGGIPMRSGGGFGDKSAQENLRKMVGRFEDFLNDNTAGTEDAEYSDEMDNDDDEESEDGNDFGSEGEDKQVSFDDSEFATVMREMMGMPVEPETKEDSGVAAEAGSDLHETTGARGEGSSENKEEEIHELTALMEAELMEAGALRLDYIPLEGGMHEQQSTEATDTGASAGEHPLSESDEDERELDIDYNLAKNMLESFKSQAGLAGPGGSLLGVLGMHLPRDEGDQI